MKKKAANMKIIFLFSMMLLLTVVLPYFTGFTALAAEKEEIIIDNSDTEFIQKSGAWKLSAGREGKYRSNYSVGSLGSGESTWFQWNMKAPAAGEYSVSFWIPNSESGVHDINSKAVYTVRHDNEVLDTKTTDQRGIGGHWNTIGSYTFEKGQIYSVRVCADGAGENVNTLADAVRFQYEVPDDQVQKITVDNTQAAAKGEWTVSKYRPGYFGENYLTIGPGNTQASVTFTPKLTKSGKYAVYTQMPEGNGDLASEVPYLIKHKNGETSEYVNQQGKNGTWQLVGMYNFEAGMTSSVTIKGAVSGYTIADAVLFELLDTEVDSKSVIATAKWETQSLDTAIGSDYILTESTDMLMDIVQVKREGYYNIRYHMPEKGISRSDDAVLSVSGKEFKINSSEMNAGYNLIGKVYISKNGLIDVSLKNNAQSGLLVFDALLLEYTGYNAVYEDFDMSDSLNTWGTKGNCSVEDGYLKITDGEAQLEPEGCLNVIIHTVIKPYEIKSGAKFGLILSGSNNTYLKLYLDTNTNKLVLYDEQSDKLLKESDKTLPYEENKEIQIQTVFEYPELSVFISGEEYLKTEYSRSGSVGFFADNSSLDVDFVGAITSQEVKGGSGEYAIQLDNPKQTIWGLGIEVQSDSIGSGNNGLPESQLRSVPYGLIQSERERLYKDMMSGFRYVRFPGGLYYRGVDEEGKHLQERWDTQNEELAEMIEMSGVEGIDFEFWSPTPYFKASGSYIHGNTDDTDGLRCFSRNFANDPVYKGDKQRFLNDFADTIVEDLKMLEANGIPVVQWGLQNEADHWVRDYSHCKYTNEEYYQTMKAVVPKIRAAFPDIHIHADSWNGQYSSTVQELKKDPELVNEIDGWTFHRIGYDSNDQINNADYYNSGKVRDDIPVYNNEFEYFSATSDWKCINTAQSIMNWMTFENSPTWHWLHVLKPFGNSEASGFSLGSFRPLDFDESKESVPEGFEGVEAGHWEYNYQNWNAIRGFLKYMPWNSIRYEVSEDRVREDNRIMSYQTQEGKQIIVLTNRSKTDLFTFNISTGLDDTWRGYRYTPQSENEITLGTLSGETISPTLPPYSIEFWVQDGEHVVPERGVELNTAEAELDVDETLALNVTIKEVNPAIPGLTWSSSDNEVVSVDKSGLAKALSAGQAIITVTRKDGGFSATCQVTVTDEAPEPGEKTDMTSLKLAITMAEKLEQEYEENKYYTEESWNIVQSALNSARDLVDNTEAEQEQADSAFIDLITACNLLESSTHKVGLKATVRGVEAILADEDGLSEYTPESVSNVRISLSKAQSVLNNTGADQGAVNQASTELMTAVTNLLVIKSDTRLDILIQIAEQIMEKSELYTLSCIENLKIALEDAKEMDQNINSEEEINKAYNNLANAMSSMIRRANKEELKNAIDKSDEILASAGNYVESTITGLEAVTLKAREVYDDSEAGSDITGEVLKKLIAEILKARLLGDIDLNGTVDTRDVAELLKYTAEAKILTQEQIEAGNVNGDNICDSSDGAIILQYAVEKINSIRGE
ncbi:Ig-like domain-containing protein [uncultured Robinsoniella sp.]|uniref:golvesin C-terminal-like domain-containing protein n=1 Tax=uncultured Robinsoniella sp. TaxID=904190 RepID=UPI00374F3B18